MHSDHPTGTYKRPFGLHSARVLVCSALEKYLVVISRSYGTICLHEVTRNIVLFSLAASYQQAMDSVLNYPLYDAIVQGFSIPGPGNMSNVSDVMSQIQNNFKVCPLSFMAIPMSNSSVGPYCSREFPGKPGHSPMA
jgi:hypothetical protein